MEHNPVLSLPGRNKLFLLSVSALSVLMAVLLGSYGFNANAVIAVSGIPIAFLLALNFEIALTGFVLSFFANMYISYATPSELMAVLAIISFFFTHRFDSRDLKNPLAISLGVFLLAVLPSFLASTNIPLTIALSSRLAVFAFLVIFLPLAFSKEGTIQMVLKVYLGISVLNALHTSYTGITTGLRAYGFAGVMFVDYVSIALIIAFINLIYYPRNKFLYLSVSLILLSGLIFTQTRNTWISCGATLMLILFQYVRRSGEFGFSRKKIIAISLALIISAAAIIALAAYLNPGTFDRLSTAGISMDYEDETAKVRSMGSLATRFFIWTTAWNAFTANPVIGIGIYNFPFASKFYSTLDPLLFKTFVEGLSPHVTFLAILTETGIIGFIGFIYFLFNCIKTSRQACRRSGSQAEFFFPNLFFWLQIYILFSMMMSDAWLWGHGLMLWGLFLAMAVANFKITNAKSI